MTKEPLYRVEIKTEADVGFAREAAVVTAQDAGFDAIAVGELNLAVSEIAQNAWRHASGGIVEVHALKNGKLIRIIVSDKGNGIGNIEMAMREGFSTIRTSLGIGLEAAQRLTDKFEIQSEVGKGTTITMEKYLPMTTDQVEYGVVCIPDEDYNFNGDEFLIKEFDGDKILLAAIDGIGQGYNAYAMSVLIKNFLQENYSQPLETLLQSCDFLLKESELTGGAALSLAIVEPTQLTYLGVGDTHSYLHHGGKSTKLFNFEGRVGDYQLANIKATKYPIEATSVLVMCTDGISTGFSDYDVNIDSGAQEIATTVFNQFHKSHGDVTVLVTKIKVTE